VNIDVNPSDYLSHGQLMAAARKAGGAPCESGRDDGCGLERVRYFPRQLLGAEDLTTEQSYFREKLRRHNRYLHGWGVACGCAVRAAPTKEKPYQVLICPGYIVTPCGDEILIGRPALFDLATCMLTSDDPCAYARPCPPVTSTMPIRSKIYLSVCYKECEVRPVRVAPVGCSCDDANCDYSRIRDAYEFTCRDALPGSHQKHEHNCDDLCKGGVFPCPPVPTDNCVILATIQIKANGVQDHAAVLVPTVAAAIQIDELSDRRLLYSTAMLQQMAHCQCQEVTPPVAADAPTVETPVISPDNGGFADSVLVSISDATPGASIYYTTHGSDPNRQSILYSDSVSLPLDGELVVKAIAVKAGYLDSAIASATYQQTAV
jgi:hypothetical protein